MAPLDWGLGHATRCIPLIHALIKAGHKIWIATDGPQEALLKKEFPDLDFLKLPGYKVRYSRSRGWLPLKIMQQMPGLFAIVQREHRWLEKVIEQYNIQLVISDNRYGLWSNQIPCVFITHQLTIKAPYRWLETLIRKINYRYINRFTACWVPDMKVHGGLAGVLSHPTSLPRIPVHYMGLLSRFEKAAEKDSNHITILLSGPEPQRGMLEEKIIQQLPAIDQPVILVRGLPGSTEKPVLPNHVQSFNHLETAALQAILIKSKLVITRSGYTSVMELMDLQIKTVLVPTPGQTEQEYIADILCKKGYAVTMKQADFSLPKAIEAALDHHYIFPDTVPFNQQTLDDLLDTINDHRKLKDK